MELLGLEFADLPENTIVTDAIVLVVGLTPDGTEGMYIRHSDGLGDIKGLGMLEAARGTQRASVQASWDGDEDDEP